MRFGSAEFFWAYLLIPFFLFLYVHLMFARKKAIQRFGDKALVGKLLPKDAFTLRPLKGALFLLGFIFLVFALTRPRFGLKTEIVERKGIDLFIALDVSKSMLAEDIVPNRIKRAKHEIGKLIDMLTGDRVGLIVFAGKSFTQTPLTLDYGAALLFLDAVNTEWIGTQGSDLSGAIELARKSFPSQNSAGKVMLMISDGEEQQGDAVKVAQKAAEEGIVIYTVGVGSETGIPIPIKQQNGNVVYKKDADDNVVLTRLNAKILEEIALSSGGRYFAAGVDLNLAEIYREINEMEKTDFGMGKQVRYHEQYQLFLLIALVLFLLEFFIPDSIKKKNIWRGRFV